MQNMDSSITKTQKRNLTDMQEKFLDVLFGEAKGNPREAARIAGYSEHSYPKVIRNLKKEITELAETHLSTHSAKAATRLTDLLDEDGTTPHSNIRSEEHTSELQSRLHLVCRLLLEKKNRTTVTATSSMQSSA